ncbi:centrosome-associated protein 350-like isoform X2 [Cylas formicarius]|nr:centrosome-associated protein 350-like isoform X2 [Cylas formicarius]
MFDQLIKDEDIRLENLRKILKIREKTLLDRTKGELAWLEIQRKQLKETGKVQEASVIKKKQRGILVRHQQEKHEMQRLKQMQKEAATNRKHVLKQQQNLIKKQMHNDIMLPKLKSFHQKERRLSGPLKVIQSHTSDSVKSNLEDENRTAGVTDDEVCTKTSQTFSVVCVRSESDNNISKVESLEITGKYDRELDISTMKRTLLMKERALEKRRKAAEELLKWHKKLLEEEKAIVELEATASRIISQIPSAGKVKIGKFNTLKRNVSEPDVTSLEKETTVRSMSRCSEKLGSSVTDFSLYARELVEEEERYIPKKQSEESAISSNYTADFEAESVPEDLNVDTVEQSKISSISDLIENFSKIQEDISNLSHVQSKILSENEEAKAPEAGDEKPSSVISSAVSVESVVQLTTEEESEQAQSNANVSTEEGNIVLNEPTEDTNTAIQTSASVEEPVESQEFDTEVEMGGANQTFVVTRGTEGEEDKSEQPVSMDETFERPSSTSKNESEHQNSADSNHSSSISSQISKDVKEDANAEEQSRITESQANVSEGTRLESVEENLSLTSPASLSVREVTEQDVASTSSDKISTENKTDEEKAASISKQTAGASSLQDDVQMSEQKDTESRTVVDVKQRVSEIMSEVSRCEKSPRMQDLCVMTYDLTSPPNSPELDTASEIDKRVYLGSVAEELLKKQLAIEQEIKLLTEQQVIYREIPNKPPPPYTPPATVKPVPAPTVIPRNKEEIEEITKYSAKIIYKAYMSKNLENITISDNTLNLIAKNIDKNAYKFVFDLCKEVAIEHFGQFEEETCPSWFRRPKKVTLAPAKPLDATGLEKLMHKKLLEIFGYEKRNIRESTIIKWSRKKRDHVDELLVQEMQAEESSWTNFDDDELIVKDRVTNEILEQLLQDTAQCLLRVWQKKCQK